MKFHMFQRVRVDGKLYIVTGFNAYLSTGVNRLKRPSSKVYLRLATLDYIDAGEFLYSRVTPC